MIYAVLAILIMAAALAFPVLREHWRAPMDDAARRDAEGGFAHLSQGVTHYRWIGPLRGPVAVCVHGLTTPSFVWFGLADGLARLGYRVLVYDLYGRGLSDRPEGEQDAAFFLRQLDELLADQEVGEDITLLGYSMGGAIATLFTARNPPRVRQLVLLAPAGIEHRTDAVTRFAARSRGIGDWLVLATYPNRMRQGIRAEEAMPASVPDLARRQLDELRYRGYIPSVLSSLRGVLSETLEPAHRAIRKAGVPVLAIWGEKDETIPPAAMGTLAEWSRNARQEVIPGAGHGLVYTHTDAVLEAMRGRLREGLN